MDAILPDEALSPEDLEERKKTLALAERIEHLFKTDEEFRRWFLEGYEQIQRGEFVIFDENGWHDEVQL